jgi:transposase
MGRPSSNPETLRAAEAFEFWFWLESRSVEKVANQFNVTGNAIRKWMAKFKWDERAEEREQKIKAAVSTRADAEAVEARLKLVKIADATLQRYAVRLLLDDTTMAKHNATRYEPNAGDAARWAQMRLLLTGQATSRTEVSVGAGFVEAFLHTIKAVLRREVPRCCPTCKTDLGLPEKIGKALIEASARLASENGKDIPLPPTTAAHGLGENADDAGPLP